MKDHSNWKFTLCMVANGPHSSESHLPVCSHFPIILTLVGMYINPHCSKDCYLKTSAEDSSASKMAVLWAFTPSQLLIHRFTQKWRGIRTKPWSLSCHFKIPVYVCRKKTVVTWSVGSTCSLRLCHESAVGEWAALFVGLKSRPELMVSSELCRRPRKMVAADGHLPWWRSDLRDMDAHLCNTAS